MAWASQTPPAAVKNLAAWYDAGDNSTLTATPQNVSQWNDKSSNSETLAQSTVSSQPTYATSGINGLGAITFSGGQQLISNDATFSRLLYPTSTIFIVQSSTSDSQTGSTFWSGSSTTQRVNFSLPSYGSCIYSGAPAGNNENCLWYDFGDSQNSRAQQPTATYTTVGTHLWMGRGHAGTSEVFRRDGTTIASQTPDTDTAFGNCALSVGARGGCTPSGNYFSGSIGEIIVYDTVLNSTNYKVVEGILACKWGLQSQLPANHPYASSCPSGSESTNLNAISGLSAWYDASDASTVTYNVSYVSQMNDKSANGLTLKQSTSGSQPTLATVNGAQAVVFNGSELLASSTSNNLVTGSTPSSMFVVSAYTGSLTASAWGENITYGIGTSKASRGIGKVHVGGTAIATETSADVTATGSWSASSLTLAFASFGSTTESIAINGNSLTSGAEVPNTAASTSLRLGGDGAATPWIGPVYEAVVYNASLSTTEQQFIEGYLACKWGFQTSLPTSHPYSGYCPSTAAPGLTLALTVSPTGVLPPGTDLTYQTTFTNASGTLDYSPVLTCPIPTHTWFKFGSVTQSFSGTGLSLPAVATYSNDGGSTYVYSPTSGGGGAASGYDANVTNIRWTFSGPLGPAPKIDSGSVTYTARII